MTTNFLGIPVEGQIRSHGHKFPQKSLEQFAELLEPVLYSVRVVELGWTQYTPYFNDGDPCVFRVRDVWVRTTEDPPPTEDEGYYDYEGMENLDVSWSLTFHPSLNDDSALGEAALRLGRKIDGGHFDDVLLQAFGDHALVILRKDYIRVDKYIHE